MRLKMFSVKGMLVDLHVSMLGDPDQDYERYALLDFLQ
jgi:hypothetical protein